MTLPPANTLVYVFDEDEDLPFGLVREPDEDQLIPEDQVQIDGVRCTWLLTEDEFIVVDDPELRDLFLRFDQLDTLLYQFRVKAELYLRQQHFID